MPCQGWSQQWVHNHPWEQGWKGPSYGSIPAYTYRTPPQPSHPMPSPQQYSQQPYPEQVSYPTQPQTKLTAPPQQLQLPSTQPMRPTQFPFQPIPNPNNKVAQPVFNTELEPFPTYLVTPVDLQGIQLRSGKVLNKNSPTIIEEELEEETLE
jgi:hypothetical protein